MVNAGAHVVLGTWRKETKFCQDLEGAHMACRRIPGEGCEDPAGPAGRVPRVGSRSGCVIGPASSGAWAKTEGREVGCGSHDLAVRSNKTRTLKTHSKT